MNNEAEYKIDDILNRRYYYKRLQYKIKQTVYKKDDNQYYIDNNEFENLADVINEYFKYYPKRTRLELTKPDQEV